MKKAFLIAAILALIVILSASKPTRLVKFTIVNKSGLALEVSLTGACDENVYYLRVPEGDRALPMVKDFTIVPDTYKVQPYYVQIWDPVYGYDCSDPSAKQIDISHNTRVVIAECDRTLPNSGEPSMVKFGGAGGRKRGR